MSLPDAVQSCLVVESGCELRNSSSYPQALMDARTVKTVSLESRETLGVFCARPIDAASANHATHVERREQNPRKASSRTVNCGRYEASLRGSARWVKRKAILGLGRFARRLPSLARPVLACRFCTH